MMFSSVELVSENSCTTILVGIDSSLAIPKGLGSIRSEPGFVAAVNFPSFLGKIGATAEVVSRGKRVILFGIGSKGTTNWADATAPVFRRLAQLRIEAALLVASRADYEEIGLCLGLLQWNPIQWKGSATTEKPLMPLELRSADADRQAFLRGQNLAKSINLSRTLSMTPPNEATPAYIADLAKAVAKETGITCRVIEGDELLKEGLTGLHNVGKASVNKPCLIRLAYRPKGSKKAPLVLIGKTLTYDTGGLSLKISGGMVGMKQDKDGGCAVLGAMHAIATVIKPDRPVIALLCAAENSVSENAYRPDDVLKFKNGVTVEVTNTDAEGRLVLADGLCWASEHEEPAAIVDIATLTGGVVTALGKVYAGLFANNEELFGTILNASQATGDRVWRLPLHDEYREMMKSPIADILNSNPNRQAHPIQGAAFLSHFVADGTPWAHLDIAGVHNFDKDSGANASGPNGFGVRLLSQLAAIL